MTLRKRDLLAMIVQLKDRIEALERSALMQQGLRIEAYKPPDDMGLEWRHITKDSWGGDCFNCGATRPKKEAK